MKTILTTFLLLLAIDTLAVQVHVETDRQCYYVGQELNVYVMAVNTEAAEVVLEFSGLPEFVIEPDGPCGEVSAGLPMLSSVTIPAYGTNVWSRKFDWDRWPLSTGSHSINGLILGYGEATSASFLVEQAVLPKDKVLIDFYSIPGTNLPASSLFAYEAAGIHFSTETTANKDLSWDRTNRRLEANGTTYPPGFNIIAELDFPVYGISVDAYTSTGVQITLIAKDRDGQVITSETTEPAIQQVAQPIRLRASRRIERLEWWPSNDHSSVSIGNLCLYRQPYIYMEHTQQVTTLHWAPDVVQCGLEVCTDLEHPEWETLLSSIGTNEVSIPTTNSPACFYRLIIESDI